MTAVSPGSLLGVVRDFPGTILIALLKAYRLLISPLYGQVCRFFPSCSAYTLEAVTVHGALKGSWLGFRRICRCHPWNDGGVDHVPSGGKTWDPDRVPKIVQLNHPEIPADEESRPAA